MRGVKSWSFTTPNLNVRCPPRASSRCKVTGMSDGPGPRRPAIAVAPENRGQRIVEVRREARDDERSRDGPQHGAQLAAADPPDRRSTNELRVTRAVREGTVPAESLPEGGDQIIPGQGEVHLCTRRSEERRVGKECRSRQWT